MNSIFDTNDECITIPFSKYKLAGLLLIALSFAVLSAWFVINPSTFASIGNYHYHHRPPLEIFIVGLIGFISSCGATIYFGYRFFSSDPGLIIDQQGITDNSSAASTGFIAWGDITKISMETIGPVVYVMIHINHAEEFIERQNNSFKKKTALANYKKYDAPIAIITDGLKCNFNELYTFLTDTLNTYKNASKG